MRFKLYPMRMGYLCAREMLESIAVRLVAS